MPPTSKPPLPAQIGRYEILRRLAKGGMAEVFLGRAKGQGGYQKLAAIKRILPHLAEDHSFVGMFIDEARISAGLSHSNIAQIFDFGQAGSSFFIAIEYVRGVDVRAILTHYHKKEEVAPPALVAYVLSRVAGALDYAHHKPDDNGQPLRIIHRDVSPTNVLVSFEGEVKLIDFGIAKAVKRTEETAVGTLKGKCSYMSPEQVTAGNLDMRSDIFSLGTVLYEMLTGEHPFRAADELITLDRIRKAEPAPPSQLVTSVPAELEAICLRALSHAPGDRYATAGEMEAELERFSHTTPLTRRELSEWIKRAFKKRLERPLIPRGGAEGLGRRLKGKGGEGSGPAELNRTPTPLRGMPVDPDPAAIMDLDTALRRDPDATSKEQVLVSREPPPWPLEIAGSSGNPGTPAPAEVEELPLVPLEDIIDEVDELAPVMPPAKLHRPMGMMVILSVLLALGTIAAVGYLVYTGVQRGPHWLPKPNPVPVTSPLDDGSATVGDAGSGRGD